MLYSVRNRSAANRKVTGDWYGESTVVFMLFEPGSGKNCLHLVMARDITTTVLLVFLSAAALMLAIRYGRAQCPPCRQLRCQLPDRGDIRLPLSTEIVVVKTPAPTLAPTPTPMQEVVIAGPRRSYVSSNDTRWHEIGIAKGEGDRSVFRLFGHRKYARSEKWEYFMRTKDGIDVPFKTPKDVELLDGDSITVPGFNGQMKAVIFPIEQLAYNPNVY